MRTTVDLDEDVLRVAKDLAREQGKSIGAIISDLARNGLQRPPSPMTVRNGVPLLSSTEGARPVTSEIVNQLLDLDE